MIFDTILKQYTLHEDNTGQDDQQNQRTQQQDTDDIKTTNDSNTEDDEYSIDDPDKENNDDTTEDTSIEGDENQTDDEYTITDPDNQNDSQDTDDIKTTNDSDTEDDEYSIDDPDKENNDDTLAEENNPSAKLKELEKSIFDHLPIELQKAKNVELKKLYTDTYNKCQSIIDIISTADKQPDQVKIYDYILNTLLDLQKYITDYLSNIYDSKTYIENMTELQKYLAILDTVNGVFEDMAK